MRKADQIKINEEVKKAWGAFVNDLGTFEKSEKLRSCSATVVTTDKYFILQSYNTVVAIIDRATDTLYDALRLVYGFTSTSAQHISKFEKDYCAGMWGCSRSLRYYDV